MKTDLSGSVYGDRQGSATVRHTVIITTADQGTIPVPYIGVIRASAWTPVLLEAQIYVRNGDNAGAPTISFGVTSASANELISGAATGSAGVFLPASNVVGKYRLTADTQIYYKVGGIPQGDGDVIFILDVTTVNVNPS